LAKDPKTGRIVPIIQAIEEGLVDASSGRLANMNLAEALSKGFLLTTSARVSLASFRFSVGMTYARYHHLLHLCYKSASVIPLT
jgi:hypothetical protein